MTGIELIAEERERQIEKHGYNPEHDAQHDTGDLALAAACYAAPCKLYEMENLRGTIFFRDPYPFGEVVYNRGEKGYRNITTEEKKEGKNRIKQLQIAGAFIAAEIDRLLNKSERINRLKHVAEKNRSQENS